MTDHLVAAVCGAIAALILHVFFRSVQHRWPESYSTLRGALEAFVAQRLSHYLVFRTAPVYMTAVFLGVTTGRLGANPSTAIVVMTGAHLAATNGRAVIAVFRRRERERRAFTLFLYHSVTALLILIAAGFAAVTFRWWGGLIPFPREVVFALWTGVIAAVLGAYIQSFKKADPTEAELVEQAQEDMGKDIWDYAQKSAWNHACDPDLVRAVLVTEVTQRPRWMRRLERTKGRLVPSGTYGAAQVTADKPLSDRESIDALAASFAGYHPDRTEAGSVIRERLAARLETHNPSIAFRTICMAVYDHLQGYPIATAVARAADQRPIIEVVCPERRGRTWLLSGTASVFEGNIAYHADTDDGPLQGATMAAIGGPQRGPWELKLPLSARKVWLFEENANRDIGTRNSDREVYVDIDLYS